MTAADQSLAKQALARQDLKLIGRRERKLHRYIAQPGLSHAQIQEAQDQLDDLKFERDTVEMAMETHHRMTPASADADHAAGMEGGPEPTAEQRQRWADADVQYDAYYQDRGIA